MPSLCSVCGHSVYYHAKAEVLDPEACIVGGLSCASHTYATSVAAEMNYLFNKLLFQAEPILYCPLNNTPNDSGGQANNGTWSGTEAYENGPNGVANTAATFNGSSYITLDNESNFDFNHDDALSISFWTKHSSSARDQYISKRANDAAIGWSLRNDTVNTGQIEFQLEAASGTLGINIGSATAINDGAWHHVVLTYSGNGLASGVTIYVDGVDDTDTASKDDLAGNSVLNNDAVVIAGHDGGGSDLLTGAMSNVAVWDFALSQQAVTALYNSGTMVTVLA